MQGASRLTTVAASASHQGSPPSSWGGPMKARSLLALLLTLGLLASGCSDDDGGSAAGDGTWPDSI